MIFFVLGWVGLHNTFIHDVSVEFDGRSPGDEILQMREVATPNFKCHDSILEDRETNLRRA